MNDDQFPPPDAHRGPSIPWCIVAGLVAAGVALAVDELLAGLNRTWARRCSTSATP